MSPELQIGLEIARKLLGIALDLVPIEMLRPMLDQEAIKRAHTAAAIANDLKFGPRK